MTKTVKIGNVVIGGGAPIAIQSMTNADTCNTEAVVLQIHELEKCGCEIIRVAAYNTAAAQNIKNIKNSISIPIVADVHFDYRIAIAAIENGADKVRINPGNIGSDDKIRKVVDAAKTHHIPIRVGANTGSLKKEYYGGDNSDALVFSAMENVKILENMNFYDTVISLKSSNVYDTVRAYRKISKMVDYPLHLGVTEAGLYDTSIIKSSIGIGSLLLDGIGDTMRVSITGDLLDEIHAAKSILKYSGSRDFGAEIICCPTCARTTIDVEGLARKVTEAVKNTDKHLKIAVMGCVVNGPGEAKGCDIGIAGGKGQGILFIKGEPVKRNLNEDQMLEELLNYIKIL